MGSEGMPFMTTSKLLVVLLVLKAEVAALRSQLDLKELPTNTNLEEDADAVSEKKIDGSDMIDDFLESGKRAEYISEERMDYLVSKIIYTGKGDHPSWKLKGASLKGVTVTCPCNHSDGKKMSERDALRRILRQVGDIGISEHIANEVINTKSVGAAYTQKIALSTTMMFRCWQSKCSAGITDQEELVQFGGGTCW